MSAPSTTGTYTFSGSGSPRQCRTSTMSVASTAAGEQQVHREQATQRGGTVDGGRVAGVPAAPVPEAAEPQPGRQQVQQPVGGDAGVGAHSGPVPRAIRPSWDPAPGGPSRPSRR
ncbi:hypothetical protein ACFV6E_30475 [Streptomyces sp. NPDC059785]|uniref:hypothetical protein n=1 Tax=unclassified Streptomyces TaxID=2593676 RepID=UPI00365F19D9